MDSAAGRGGAPAARDSDTVPKNEKRAACGGPLRISSARTARAIRLALRGWRYAAPAMYRANRPQRVHRSVTCDLGGGGTRVGSRSIGPEQDGQLNGEPLRSLAMR